MNTMDHDLEKQDPAKSKSTRGSFLGKFNPLKSGEESTDVDTSTSENTGTGSSRGGNVNKLMSMFSKAEPAPKPKPTTIGGKMIAMLPEESNKMKALMFFGFAALFLLLSLVNIFSIILSPAKFTCMFTIAVIMNMVGLALWNGP